MENVFLKLCNMSIAASWGIIAVLVLRLLLHKAPKWMHCVLWAIVAVRLVCPFSFESVFSLIPSAETISPTMVQYAEGPAIDTGIPAIDSTLSPIIKDTFTPTPENSVNPLHIWIFVGSIVWIIGLAVLLGYAALSYLQIRREVEEAVRLYDNVYICDGIKSPFIMGIFCPRIYLPSDMENVQMDYVLAHERAHLKRKDHWWKPLGYVLLAVYWFNPLVWAAYILLCRDIELACDEKVVHDWNMNERKAYSEALLACSMKRRMIMACPIAFGEVGVKERVKTVLHYKKPAFWLIAVSIVVCAAVAVCFLTNPKKNSNSDERMDNTQEELVDNTQEVLLEAYDSNWSVDKIRKEIAKRNPYLEKCTFYGDVLIYMGNQSGVSDISILFEPIFDTDILYYSEEDFQYFAPPWIIPLAECEIYARHGCIFQDEDLNNYFMGQLWYLPVIAQEDFDDAELNACEKKNLMLLERLNSGVPSAPEGTQSAYYIKGADGDSLILDEVEWVTDEKRAAEIGLGEDDMPGGFYIYNEEETEITCSFSEECSFTVLDWEHGYRVIKMDKQAFLDMIDNREFVPPYYIRIVDGKIISIMEQYVP